MWWKFCNGLTHWGRVTHICFSNLTIIGSDNGLAPGRRQTITWNNVGILLIGSLGTNFSEMLIAIHTFSLKKINLKMLSGKWQPFCLGLNVLMNNKKWFSSVYKKKNCHIKGVCGFFFFFTDQYFVLLFQYFFVLNCFDRYCQTSNTSVILSRQ